MAGERFPWDVLVCRRKEKPTRGPSDKPLAPASRSVDWKGDAIDPSPASGLEGAGKEAERQISAPAALEDRERINPPMEYDWEWIYAETVDPGQEHPPLWGEEHH